MAYHFPPKTPLLKSWFKRDMEALKDTIFDLAAKALEKTVTGSDVSVFRLGTDRGLSTAFLVKCLPGQVLYS